MKNKIRKYWTQFASKLLQDRACVLIAVILIPTVVLAVRLTSLQLIHGDKYQKSFQSEITKTIHIEGIRGRILDRNGKVIAESTEVKNVVMVDVTGNSAEETARLNSIIRSAIALIESHGDNLSCDFGIGMDGDSYIFTKTEGSLTRFLADIYGHADPADLTPDEVSKSAEDVVSDLVSRYMITSGGTSRSERKMLLQSVIVRYCLSLNTYQKYNSTTLAKGVSDATVKSIENASDLDGVSIQTSHARVYYDSEAFSSVTGYTGQINDNELTTFTEQGLNYRTGDYVGKVGIEASQETSLHGESGQRIISVDSMGREQEELSYTAPSYGDDVYLTIDANLQKAAYSILEQNLTSILLEKMTESVESFTITEDTDNGDIVIPANDVYAAVLNNVIDTSDFESEEASESEQMVYRAFTAYHSSVKSTIESELQFTQTNYGELAPEYQSYENYIAAALYDRGVLLRDEIDTDDPVYQSWIDTGDVSMAGFLTHAIEKNWINAEVIGVSSSSNQEAIYKALVQYILENPCEDYSFGKRVYRYMCISGAISGNQVCSILFEQGLASASDSDKASIANGTEHEAYVFIRKLIQNHTITPAQLALYPYCGSMVITDVKSGDVLALVSYPGYDCGRMDESDYYYSLVAQSSKPMLNYATQQRTAPGSTFKMVSATAGLAEGKISLGDTIRCSGPFEKIDPSPKCWIFPSAHGSLNVEGAIANSCNSFFYEVGYRLGQNESGKYDSERGTDLLAKYASLYGLDQKSGVEIEETEPSLASRDSVRAAIGQSNNSFSTAALARYVTAVASNGDVYDLTLLKKTVSASDGTETAHSAELLRHIDLDDTYWNAIHRGMRRVVQGKSYFSSLATTRDGSRKSIQAAGKTGTAQQATNAPNHALFLGYAPYDDPEIAVATRIPNGYTSDYAAQITQQVMSYYYNPDTLNDILKNSRLASSNGED